MEDESEKRSAAKGQNRARYAAYPAVVGLWVTFAITLVLAAGKTVSLLDDLIAGTKNQDLAIVSVLEIIDAYLLAIVQLIVVFGLYGLFIADLRLPKWLEARTLEDVKKPIVDVLVVFVAIKGIERFLTVHNTREGLESVASVALIILALTAFRAFTKSSAGKG